jgi:tetratricopeptide (TPR) repeat protein
MSVQLMVSKVQRNPAEAIKAQRERLLLHVNDADTLHKLGRAYADQGDLERAVAFLCQAVAADQKNSKYFTSLGNVLSSTGRYMEAICTFRQALTMDGELAAAYDGLGTAQSSLGEFELAAASFRAAAQKDSLNPKFWAKLASSLLKQHKYVEAKHAAMRAYRLDKKMSLACSCLAESELGQARLDAGLRWARRAFRLSPNLFGFRSDIARAYRAKNRLRQAVTHFKLELSRFPQNVEAQFGISQSLLAMGNFSDGWSQYEWRLKRGAFANSLTGKFIGELTEPMWAGEELGGKTLLVYSEQGFGDIMQTIRFVPEIGRRGCRIILMVYKELVPLLKAMPAVSSVIAYGDLIPRYDYHIPIFSLPGLLKANLETIPCDVPYISVPSHRTPPPILRKPGKFRVGFCWSTRRIHTFDFRSIQLCAMRPLFGNKSVSFFSLQLNDQNQELKNFSQFSNVHDLKPFIEDWRDTALLISKMDLVISIDTAIAHLAGALGKPVWVLLPRTADWRWMTVGKNSRWFERTPWYPTMRLFRSKSNSRWDGVIKQVKNELTRIVKNP